MIRALVLGISLFASLSAVATDLQMVQVESTYPRGYHGQLVAHVDARGAGLTGFTFSDSRGTKKDYTVDDLHKGVLLVKALGKEILKIKGKDFSAQDGGVMVLTFLRGFFGSDRRDVHFDYVRTGGATDWAMLSDDPQGRDPFDSLKVVVGTSAGIPSGVAAIELKNSGQTVRHYDPLELPRGTQRLRRGTH